MTSEELLPRFEDLLNELNQITNNIDYNDDAAESLQTLLEIANDTKTEMQTAG